MHTLSNTTQPILMTYCSGDVSVARQLRARLDRLVAAGQIRITGFRVGRGLLRASLGEAVLARSRVYMPILSPEFLACHDTRRQLHKAVALARRGQLVIIPVLARAADIRSTPLDPAYPPIGAAHPPLDPAPRGSALSDLANAIRRVCVTAAPTRPKPTPCDHRGRQTCRRILAMFATPCPSRPLRVDHERRLLEAELRKCSNVSLRCLSDASIDDLHRELLEGEYDTVHLSCHHKAGHGLTLSNACGDEDLVDPGGVAQLLRLHGVRDVVLNVCESDQIVTQFHGFQHVIAMQGEIVDAAAITFSRHFYKALAVGSTLDYAFAGGRACVQAMYPFARDQPMLFRHDQPRYTGRQSWPVSPTQAEPPPLSLS